MNIKYLYYNLTLFAILFGFSCSNNTSDDIVKPPTPPQIENEEEIVWDDGVLYVWDESEIPEITIEVSVDQWNNLLKAYDKNKHTEEYVHCNVKFIKGDEITYITDAGLRLRGNTSRVRPGENMVKITLRMLPIGINVISD